MRTRTRVRSFGACGRGRFHEGIAHFEEGTRRLGISATLDVMVETSAWVGVAYLLVGRFYEADEKARSLSTFLSRAGYRGQAPLLCAVVSGFSALFTGQLRRLLVKLQVILDNVPQEQPGGLDGELGPGGHGAPLLTLLRRMLRGLARWRTQGDPSDALTVARLTADAWPTNMGTMWRHVLLMFCCLEARPPNLTCAHLGSPERQVAVWSARQARERLRQLEEQARAGGEWRAPRPGLWSRLCSALLGLGLGGGGGGGGETPSSSWGHGRGLLFVPATVTPSRPGSGLGAGPAPPPSLEQRLARARALSAEADALALRLCKARTRISD
eukprot:tig00000194_g14825.t1